MKEKILKLLEGGMIKEAINELPEASRIIPMGLFGLYKNADIRGTPSIRYLIECLTEIKRAINRVEPRDGE